MEYVPWIKPRAILLTRENYPIILLRTPVGQTTLDELVQDSSDEGMPYYIVAYRDSTDGLPRWESMTLVELAVKYNLESVKDRFLTRFERI